MAARRLLIILVLLMAASIAAAALAPNRTGQGLSTSETTTTAPDPDPTGESVTARVDASVGTPETVEGFVGDQLELSVGSDPPRTIEITPFGLIGEAAPEAPARFDLLLRDAGAIPITDALTGDVVARLVVEEPRESGGPGGGSAGTGASEQARRGRATSN